MSYLKTATIGVLWVGIGSIVSKLASFLSLFVLGWYLSKEDFALYAIAYSCSSVFIAIRNGGVQQILIQRGIFSYNRLSRYFFKYSLMFNILAFVLLLLFSFVAARIYNNRELIYIIALISLSLPLGSFSMLPRVQLAIRHEFPKLAKLDAYPMIIRHICAATFAYLGFGTYSFVMPIVIANLLEIIIGIWYTRSYRAIKSNNLKKNIFKKIFNVTVWVMLSSIATALVLQGDYLVIGIFENKEVLGTYFFGFQLTMAISVVINSGLQAVAMPILSKLNNDKTRQINAFNYAFKLYSTIVIIIIGAFITIADPLISLLWKGKWDSAILITQIISVSMITRLLIPLSRSLLEARRKWKISFYLLVVDAIGILSSAAIGIIWGGIIEITISIGVYRFIYGLFHLYVTSRVTDSRMLEPLFSFFIILLLFMLAVSASIYVNELFFEKTEISEISISSVAYIINIFIIIFLFKHSLFEDLTNYSKNILRVRGGGK